MNTSQTVVPSWWQRTFGAWLRQVGDAFFLDLPFIVDSRWRHIEYTFSRNHDYIIQNIDGKNVASMQLRARYRNAAFILLILTLIFVAYGPTFASLCGTGSGAWLPRILYGTLGTTFAIFGLELLRRSPNKIFMRCAKRLIAVEAPPMRALTLRLAAAILLAIAVTVCAAIAILNWQAVFDEHLCRNAQFHWRSWAQAGFTVLTATAAFIFSGVSASASRFIRRQSLLIIAAWGIHWWLLATPLALEADGVPYRHTFAVFAAALFALPLFAAALARRLFRSVPGKTCEDFAVTLSHTELFMERGDPQLSLRRLINALINGPLYHPLHLFFLPALVAVMTADEWLWILCITAFVFSALLLTWGYISTRWQQMIVYLNRWFFSRTPLIVSLGVIGIAAARLMGNQYVTTLLGAAPFGVIFMWVLMTYALLWLFEQATGQALAPQLLRILNNCKVSTENLEPEFIPYPAENISQPLVEREQRYIAVHGAGRFVVVGIAPTGAIAFHTYDTEGIFDALAAHADAVEEKDEAFKGLNSRLIDATADLDRRIKLYFNVLNFFVLAICGALAWHVHKYDSQHSADTVVTANMPTSSDKQAQQHFDLTAALQTQASKHQPAFIVAASGGGTRAAVYTASALRGLAQLGISDDIVLMSGVSGGGVALAYYAAHRPELRSGAQFDAKTWQRYRSQMAEPFIQDVLKGSMEWRIAGSAPLTSLLVESFERRLNHGDRDTLGSIDDVGIILNTAITGHPPGDSVLVGNAIGTDAAHPHYYDCLPFTLLSGGRLVFTNIADTQDFPAPLHSKLPDVLLPYIAVNDPHIELWRAAALNANFPPVFPNARVDLRDASFACGGRRTYFVTDGGATENLGLLSALYALQSSLDALKKQSHGAPIELPEIHIVALEASAIGYDYTDDRGIGTATGGAKERLAGGLTEQLLGAIEKQLADLSVHPVALHLHYLAMPTVFRSRGGLGTHWMMPDHVTLTNPHLATLPDFLMTKLPFTDREQRVHVRLSREELFQLLDQLHDPEIGFCASRVADEPRRMNVATDWICGRDKSHPTTADLHVLEWNKLVTAKLDVAKLDGAKK